MYAHHYVSQSLCSFLIIQYVMTVTPVNMEEVPSIAFNAQLYVC